MTHIIAIGSPFNDDNISWIIIDKIKSKLLSLNNSIGFTYSDRPGMQLITAMKGKKNVILIDAMLTGIPLGQVQQIKPENLALENDNISTHNFSVAHAIALAQQLKSMPENLYIFGISIDDEHLLNKDQILLASKLLYEILNNVINSTH
jgi:hydrogenase maturation protease